MREQAELHADLDAFDVEVPRDLWAALDRAGLLPAADPATTGIGRA